MKLIHYPFQSRWSKLLEESNTNQSGCCTPKWKGAGLSFLLLLPAFDGINDCIHQFQLLLCGAVQPVNLGDNRFSMYSCDPAGKFFLARLGLGVVYDHMDRCGFSNTLSPLFSGVLSACYIFMRMKSLVCLSCETGWRMPIYHPLSSNGKKCLIYKGFSPSKA